MYYQNFEGFVGGIDRKSIEALRQFLAPDPKNEILSIKRRLSDVEQLEGLRSAEAPN
jgi:hypothetical protein